MTDTDASQRTAVTDEFARLWIHRFLDAWRFHDPEQLAQLATEDVHWEDPFIPSNGELHGRDALKEWVRYIWKSMPDIAFDLVGEPMVSLDHDRVAFEWTGQGRMTGALDPPGFAPTGTVIAMRGVDIHTFRGDLVAHVVTITDVAAVALQIGAMPPAGSIGERMGVQVQHLMAKRLRRKS